MLEEQQKQYLEKISSNVELSRIFQQTCFRKVSDILDHIKVKRLLIDMEIISFEDDFHAVRENKALMDVLRDMLIINSSRTVDNSINPHHFVKTKKLHPSKYFSDFDLMARIKNKEDMRILNNERNPDSRLTDEEAKHYFNNVRRTLRKEFIEMRNTMVYNFGLDGSYDLNEKTPKPKPPRKVISPEEVHISFC